MVYGFGRGQGGRVGGARLGFRGSSPPWPYVGRGRGGLPRCRYPSAALSSRDAPVLPYAAQITREQELDLLKGQAGEIKKELDRVESRIRDLEANKKE
jgi:hypothetical protein